MDGTLGIGARMGAHWRFAEDAPVQGLGTLAAGGRCCWWYILMFLNLVSKYVGGPQNSINSQHTCKHKKG